MPNPWTRARRLRLTSIADAIAEANAALAAPTVAAAALPPAVLAYFDAHGVTPPLPHVWSEPPASGTCGHDVFMHLRDPHAHPVGLVTVQRLVLVHGWSALQWHLARAHWPADGEFGLRTVSRADGEAAATALFRASNAYDLVTEYWTSAWAWRECWWERGTEDADTLAAAGFGPAELTLLAADEERNT